LLFVYWLLVIGYWLLVSSFQFPVSGFQFEIHFKGQLLPFRIRRVKKRPPEGQSYF
jgi:hypothetical protein